MGAIVGALIGRKFAEKINADKMKAQMVWHTVQDGTFNPDTTITPDVYEHALDEFKKLTVGKQDQEAWENFRKTSQQHAAVYQKARQALPSPVPATANPSSAPSAMMPTQSGGLGLPAASPDTAQGNAGPMSQPPQVPTGIPGIAQKKTTDLAAPVPAPAAPDQSIQPDSSSPPPVSGQPSPGFTTVAPVNTPAGDVPPPNWAQVSSSELGRRKAAREVPAKSAEYEAQYGAQARSQAALSEARLKQSQEFIKGQRTENPDIHWKMHIGPTGQVEPTEDGGTPLPGVVRGKELGPNVKGVGGLPIDRSGNTLYTQIKFVDRTIEAVPQDKTLATGTTGAGDLTQFNRYIPGSAAEAGAVAPSLARPRQFTGPNGEVFLQSPAQLAAGGPATPVPGAVNPIVIPRTTTSEHVETVQGKDGPELRVIPLTATRTVGLPAPTAAGTSRLAGRSLGQKPLTPQATLAAEQSLGALDNTLTIAKRIQESLPLINSLIDAKKISFQVDPKQGIVTAIINRNVPLNPQEAQLAADVQSMTEHINTLRGPLGATGFRGAEAFGALQGQAGNLMANPEVTKRVLDNTIAALGKQIDAKNRALGRQPQGLAPPGITPPSSTKIQVIRLSDNLPGTIDEKDFDAKKYKRR